MKGYLVIFIVLLVVLGCNDSEPKQVPFYYKNSICGYNVQGIAFQDSIDKDYCNIILTFRNKVTNKSYYDWNKRYSQLFPMRIVA